MAAITWRCLLSILSIGVVCSADPFAETGEKVPILRLPLTLPVVRNRLQQHKSQIYENDGHDTASATWKFCTEHNLNAKSIVGIKKSVDSRARDESLEHLVKVHQSPITKKGINKLINNFQFDEAAHILLRLHHEGTSWNGPEFLSDDDTVLLFERLTEGASTYRKFTKAIQESSVEEVKTQGGLLVAKIFDGKNKKHAAKVYYKIANFFYGLNNKFSKVLEYCTKTLQAAGIRGKWTEEQPRSQCVKLGTYAALELGDINSANKRMLSCFGLTQTEATPLSKPLYKTLKKMKKTIKKIDYDLDKGYNHRALEQLNEIMDTQKFNLTQPILKGKLQMRICKA